MNFITYPHRYADVIISSDEYLNAKYQEFIGVLHSISDEDLINDFNQRRIAHPACKSISSGINEILRNRLEQIPGWHSEVEIFNDSTERGYSTDWRLDFACDNGFAVEVAFNHGEAIAWNLLKPCLSSELNHVKKTIQTRVGIYVCATNDMKRAGNFDSASGAYEKVLRYLKPMMNQLTIPMIIIGLQAPRTFRVSNNPREIVLL